jgi:hypothetical protein
MDLERNNDNVDIQELSQDIRLCNHIIKPNEQDEQDEQEEEGEEEEEDEKKNSTLGENQYEADENETLLKPNAHNHKIKLNAPLATSTQINLLFNGSNSASSIDTDYSHNKNNTSIDRHDIQHTISRSVIEVDNNKNNNNNNSINRKFIEKFDLLFDKNDDQLLIRKQADHNTRETQTTIIQHNLHQPNALALNRLGVTGVGTTTGLYIHHPRNKNIKSFKDKKKIVINCGGDRFETYKSTNI